MTLGLLGPLLCIFHLLLLLLLLSAADPVVSGVSGALHYGPQTKVLTICIDDWLGVGGKKPYAGTLHVDDAPQDAVRNRRATLTQEKEMKKDRKKQEGEKREQRKRGRKQKRKEIRKERTKSTKGERKKGAP